MRLKPKHPLYKKIETRYGPAWLLTEIGPRGGVLVWYQHRKLSDKHPSLWRVWRRTQKGLLP
jgi:hypothetical protein